MTAGKSKRGNPDYIQICGYIPTSTGREFKASLVLMGLDQNEGMGEAIALWLANKKQGDG